MSSVADKACKDCPEACSATNHNEVKKFAPFPGSYYKSAYLKPCAKTGKYPLACSACTKTFTITKSADTTKYCVVTDTEQVRACADAMDHRFSCTLAYCTPCWEDKCGYGQGNGSPRKGKGERGETFAETYLPHAEL